jgi:hypothetical protein
MPAFDTAPDPEDRPGTPTFPGDDPVHRMIEDVVVRVHLDDLDLPHVVVCRTGAGVEHLSGPFPTAIAALAAATEEEAEERRQDPDTALTFGVMALNPPSGSGPPDEVRAD